MITWPWPPSVELGPIELHVFGLFLGLAFVGAYEIIRRTMTVLGYDPAPAGLFVLAAAAGGISGARINFLITDGADDLADIVSGSGLTWYGGLIGGIVAVSAAFRVKRIPLVDGFDFAALALATGLLIGRLGCLASADGDYGGPTSLPWGMAFPEGLVPTTVGSMNTYFGTSYEGPPGKLLFVHPAPLYETLALLLVVVVLWRYRRHILARPGMMFGWYAIAAGTIRFLIEFLRFNDPALFGLTVAQLTSLALIGIGVALVLRGRDRIPLRALRA